MVVSAVVAATALTTQAEARGSIGYIGLRGSLIQSDDGDTTSGSIDYNESYEDGYGAAAFLGWVLDDSFRIEIEAGYRSADVESVHITQNDFDNSTEGNTYSVDSGNANVGAFMANLYYDIHALGDIGVLPWVGVGVGGAYVDYSLNQSFLTLAASDHTGVFAYQLMAGITVPLADSISGSVGYRYFRTLDFEYVDDFGLSFETDLTQQSIDVGVQFHL
jgi:opacity protein-like surface antigen